MAKKKAESSQPPQPPQVARKLQFHILQLVGVPLMMLIPVLAIFGAFGETVHEVTESSQNLEMHVTFPTRFRYKMIDSVTVSIRNTSDQPITSVHITFDRAYIESFSTVTFTPSVKHVTEEVYVVELTDLQPGQVQIVSLSIQAEKYGNHQGVITAKQGSDEGLQAHITTLTFP